mmetsp:Transcript_19872/g.38631  ORF Transcript_19872/g.38631 Transcript_19872/m.38631 type:complete len:195 (+) Transcript_19872:78-662(+)
MQAVSAVAHTEGGMAGKALMKGFEAKQKGAGLSSLGGGQRELSGKGSKHSSDEDDCSSLSMEDTSDGSRCKVLPLFPGSGMEIDEVGLEEGGAALCFGLDIALVGNTRGLPASSEPGNQRASERWLPAPGMKLMSSFEVAGEAEWCCCATTEREWCERRTRAVFNRAVGHMVHGAMMQRAEEREATRAMPDLAL